jgi:hypothetical protein
MQFYVAKGGQQLGPYSLIDVRQRLQNGELAYTDLAWRDGLKDWTPLSDIMGGALPTATPHSVAVWDSPKPAAKGRAPTAARLITAVVIFVIGFGFFFIVAFFLACLLGGFYAGFQVGLQHPGNGAEAGRQAGGDFAKTYMPAIMGGSALFSLVASAIAAWLMAFSDLFPWCRRR